jgi:hypothetical protein
MDIPLDHYARKHRVVFVDPLGDGKDGSVFRTNRRQAVKFFHDRDVYNRELRAYRVLSRRKIVDIAGHQVPKFIRHDDGLLAIEMSIVQPPFLLDFAAAYSAAEVAHLAFTQEVLDEREEHWSEMFGERWPAVIKLRHEFLRATGLHLLDLNPNNIRFE